MNKLTPLFIAGAIAISAGLVFAQGRSGPPTQFDHATMDRGQDGEDATPAHTMPAADTPAASSGR